MSWLTCMGLTGCGDSAFKTPQGSSVRLQGNAHGGQQPLSAALVQLYAAGTSGNGSAATPLVAQSVYTDANGDFSLTGLYSCPSPNAFVYLLASGGNPGLAAGTNNTAAGLVAGLGPCGALTDATFVQMNEATTVGSIWPLAGFATSFSHIGYSSTNASSFDQAAGTIGELVSIASGEAQGPSLSGGAIAPTAKLNTLADMLGACINSAGGSSGDGTVCGNLFRYASSGSLTPANTVDAAIAIAQAPTHNVVPLFDLVPSISVFQPVLSAAPVDWTLPIYTPPATPVITPTSGAYPAGQAVTLTDTSSNATIYYTTDSSLPTGSSTPYSGPFALNASETVRAIAISGPLNSAVVGSSYTVVPAIAVTVVPSAVTLSAGQTAQFSAVVSGSSNQAVTWSTSLNLGVISASGLYTAPSSITNAQTLTVTATSVADPSKAANGSVSLTPVGGTTYYLAPASVGGNDANSGLSPALPWLTPKHAVRCSDVILATPNAGYYSANFETGNWGTVTCPSGAGVAWLQCAVFDGCKVTASAGQPGFYVDKSYWGVQGWEVNGNNTSSNWCFGAAPGYSTPASIHHVVFANNIANGCQQGGFVSFNSGTSYGVDYLAIVGNVAYNAAQNGLNCFSGISIYQPVASDALSGTHLYVGGNVSYANVDANPCAGGTPSDGEGVILDTFDGDQGGVRPYGAQALADNNLVFSNGGRGLQVGNNSTGTGPFATIIVRQNTAWGNNGDQHQNSNTTCGEIDLFNTTNTTVYGNLAQTNANLGCGANPIFGTFAYAADDSNAIFGNWSYSSWGYNVGQMNSGTLLFSPSNVLATDPRLANPTNPGPPTCAGFTNAPTCMAQTIANFAARNGAAAGYGYQRPGNLSVYDPVFPHWLCNINLPAGLVTMGCATGP